ncbi:hypothetical protein EDD37DRAFT_216300 [Exophiala viscosa]|uniref:uncharacterized protein n=1 Tax=Exophiala viscosa TaxID=2486360 RepID=UPI0021965CDD|nr:hypothetical protein EDD37DRAFT_216300 [Exophiala viscosa]
MPPSRNHPHTRQEWEAIRPVFMRLYKEEDKKLSDVVKILATEHDFLAKEVHYKRRICTWGLDKKKKHPEMAFASRVIADRKTLGKATRLSIRGDAVSNDDVRKYWRRKSSEPDAMSLVAATPPGVVYWTPSPSPAARDPSTSHAEPVMTSEGDDDNDPQPYERLRGYVFTPHVTPFMTLNHLEPPQMVLHQAKIYIHSSMEARHDLERKDHEAFTEVGGLISRWLLKVAFGVTPYTAALDELAIDEMLPKIASKMNPFFLTTVVAQMAVYCVWGERQGYPSVKQASRKLLWKLVQHTSAAYSSSSPLAILFRTIAQHFNEIGPWTKAILEVAEDLFVTSFGNGTSLTWSLYESLARIYYWDFNDQMTLHYAQRAEEAAAASRYKSVRKSLITKEALISAHIDLCALDQAEAEIHATLAIHLREDFGHNAQHRLLLCLGEIRRMQGRRGEARWLTDQVLSARLELFGPGDTLVMDIVNVYYKRYYSAYAAESSGPVQSGCQEPLSWRCEQVNLLYNS